MTWVYVCTLLYLFAVLGCIDPREAGICLPHEHLSMSADALGVPASAQDKHLEDIPFALDNLWWIQRHPCVSLILCSQLFDELVRSEDMKNYI